MSIRYPSWLLALKSKERIKAKAIFVFIRQHKNTRLQRTLEPEFTKLIEAARWPESGMLPTVSAKTAKKLGIDAPEWDSWRHYSKLRGFIRRLKNV